MNTEQTHMQKAMDMASTFMKGDRFQGIQRLHSPRQVAEQQGTIYNDYTVAKDAAYAFYDRLRSLYNEKKQITTFGPYTPSQAVMMKQAGIEGIYLGGWATSAKGSLDEDPGADLASYPLSQVPNEAASIVRALLTADRNQTYQRYRMTAEKRSNTPAVDYRPFIIADADTGHGGDAHVRNLIRRFVEAGVTGYHIEDQKAGTKKCGHQGGKVLVSCDEQIKRLNAARFQLDLMRVPGIIVARTDAEAATLLESISDERDHPFVLGATNANVPAYKDAFLALMAYLRNKGVDSIHGHELYREGAKRDAAQTWLQNQGITSQVDAKLSALTSDDASVYEQTFDQLLNELVTTWEHAAGVQTLSEAVVKQMELLQSEGQDMDVAAWKTFARTASIDEMRAKAAELQISLYWNCETMRTPEGYYQIRGGIPFAIARSLAVAPFADLLWMETKTADLEDANMFASAVHQVFPDKMLAYNLSPSFNWDSTGMTEDEMRTFPKELGKMGFVFNFITYGGHQIDGLATDEFAQALRTEGMVALAQVQRKFRLLESPYRTPQTHVGGPRMDAALAASTGRTATTKAMGKGSTQFQHLMHSELPLSLLSKWLEQWKEAHGIESELQVKLRPNRAGSNVMLLSVEEFEERIADVVFTPLLDRNGKKLLSIHDQNTYKSDWRRKRLMTLLHVFLFNRFDSDVVHYLTPNEVNEKQCRGMKSLNLYSNFVHEVGQLLVADVNKAYVGSYANMDATIDDLLSTIDEAVSA